MKNFVGILFLSLALLLNSIELSSQAERVHPEPSQIPRDERARIAPPRLELPQNRALPLRQSVISNDDGLFYYQPKNSAKKPIPEGLHVVAKRGGSVCGVVIFGQLCPAFDAAGNQFTVQGPIHYWQDPEKTSAISLQRVWFGEGRGSPNTSESSTF